MATIQTPAFRVPARGRLITGGAIVIGGTAIFQASNFLFNSIAARTLGPDKYGDLAATVGLIYLASPFLLSIQTVASRTTTTLYAAGRARELRGLTRFYGFRLAFGAALVGVMAVLLSGPVSQVLHLRSSLPISLLGAVFVLGTLSHLQRGVVQGLQRFGVFGAGSAIEGVTKIAAVFVLLRWVWPNESGAILALMIASAFSIAFNGAVLHRLPDTTERVRPVEHPYRYSLQTLGTLVLLAMLLSTDVIAANRYLSSQAAGLYAAVSLSGKTVFFATSALTAIAFPVFSHRQDRGEDSSRAFLGLLGIVGAASGVVTGLYFAAPTILVRAIFGSKYASASVFVPWMAIAFAAYSLTYLVGMYLLSQRRAIGTGILAIFAVAQLAGFRVYHADIWQLIGVQLFVLGATAVTMTIAALISRDAPGEEISPTEESVGWQP